MIRNLTLRVALAATLSLTVAAPVVAKAEIADPVIGGRATWYAASGMIGAAGPALRSYIGPKWRGSLVSICTATEKCLVVRLTDWCACPRGLIDLSDDAFAQLAPLSKGVIGVTVTRVVIPNPPATDTDDTSAQPIASNAIFLVLFVAAFLVMLVAIGSLEPYINSIMGWDDQHREAKRRNRR